MAKKAAKKKAAPKGKHVFGVIGTYTDEQGKLICETIRDRHQSISLEGSIDRPDFFVTTDIRATSDPLWRDLFALRRRLIDGGTFTPANWQSNLLEIRKSAHNVGLKPHLGTVEYIAASLAEVIQGDPAGMWNDEPDGWSKIILIACGEAGWIQRHDLLDGFVKEEERIAAIEWAESWMNARERQLCETSIHPTVVTNLRTGRADITVDGPPVNARQSGAPPLKPAGWTRAELIEQACYDGAMCSATTFDRIREAAGVPASERGGKGQKRRYGQAELRRLIDATERGTYRNKAGIVAAWREWLAE